MIGLTITRNITVKWGLLVDWGINIRRDSVNGEDLLRTVVGSTGGCSTGRGEGGFDEEVLSEVTLSSSESELVVFTVEAVRLEFVLSALRIRRRFFLPDEQPCPLRGSTNTVYGVGSHGKRTFRSFHTPGGHRACVHTSIRSNHSIFLLLLQPHGL